MSNSIRCLTINTDASFNQKTKIGTYAFYIVCDLFKIQKGGIFKGKVNDPNQSEYQSICNAIATILAQKELPKIGLIVVNTDSKTAIKFIEKQYEASTQLINELKRRTGAKIDFRHVKSHSNIKDARSYVNEWCDNEAKRWMGIALKRNNKTVLKSPN